MGPPSFMRSVVDGNLVMQPIPALTIYRIFTFANIVMRMYL